MDTHISHGHRTPKRPRGDFTTRDPGSVLIYRILLYQMLDSQFFAVETRILQHPAHISKTGWPNSSDIEEPVMNIYNAATYNCNLIQRMSTKPPMRTPARCGVPIPTFIFLLFDKIQKTGPGREPHWDLLLHIDRPQFMI